MIISALSGDIFRYLYPEDHHSARIRKIDRLSGDELNFEDIKYQVKIEDISNIQNEVIRTFFPFPLPPSPCDIFWLEGITTF